MWKSSLTALRAARIRSPESYWPPMGLAYVARDDGRPDDALRDFRLAATLLPFDWEMLTDAAALALAQHDTADATQWLRTAVAEHPRSVRARVRLVAMERAQGDSAEARRVIEDGLRVDPDQRAMASLLHVRR